MYFQEEDGFRKLQLGGQPETPTRNVALIGAGWFIDDAIWHFLLVAYGMSCIVTIKFSLADLEAVGIHPDRGIQMVALLIATVFALMFFVLASRLRLEE